MGQAFSRGERPRGGTLVPQHDAFDGPDGPEYDGNYQSCSFSVNITMPSYADEQNDEGEGGDADADAESQRNTRGGEVVSRFTLPDIGSYLKMSFGQFSLYVESDGRMVLHNEAHPVLRERL